MNNFYKHSVLIITMLSTNHFFCSISAPQKQTGSATLDVQINRTEIALTGGFTQAFESKNLILYPPTEDNFNKWQQAVAAMQKLIAKDAQNLGVFADPLIDVNRIVNQIFIALRGYYKSLGEEDNRASSMIKNKIKNTKLSLLIEPLKRAQADLMRIKKNFESYKKPSRLEQIKGLFKRNQLKKNDSDAYFFPLINRMIMSLEILIERILTKDAKKIDADLLLLS